MSFSGSLIQNAIYIGSSRPSGRSSRGRLGARGRGEARRRRVRLHRRRRGLGGDDAREPRRVRPLADPAADAHRERSRATSPSRCSACARRLRSSSRRSACFRSRTRTREVGVARAAASSGVPMRAVERRDALARAGRRDGRAALVPALLGERPRDLRELRPSAPRRPGTARSSSRSTRSRSAGARATFASRTCRSSRAKAAASSSATRSS